MEYSQYQLAIFDALRNKRCNIVVEAVAGSGKTTTIKEGILQLDPTMRMLYLVFNKKNQLEAQEKLPSYVDVMTLNAFGHRLCCRYIGRSQPDMYKTENIFKYQVCGYDRLGEKDKATCRRWSNPIKRLVSLLKGQCCFDAGRIIVEYEKLVDLHDIDVPVKTVSEEEDFKQKLFATYVAAISDARVRDFDDQIFFPVKLELPFPRYDMVFVDECQDLNQCKIELVKRLMNAGARVMIVGDSRQAIYGFAGADVAAMQRLKNLVNGEELCLSVNYRCSKAVIECASKLDPRITPCENAPEGKVETVKSEGFKPEEKDFVLCRTTAPLVTNCLKLIRQGKKAVVLGRDIGKGLTDVVCQLGKSEEEVNIEKLESWYSEQYTKLSRAKREQALQALEDKFETIKCLFEHEVTYGGVISVIDKIFSDDVSGITFSTIHKAKGLEADNVWILPTKPFKGKISEWQAVQEQNLLIVARTRAKINLYFVE